MAIKIFNNAMKAFVQGDLDFDTHSFKVMLCAAGYTPDIDAHDFRSSVTNEISGTGYTAGGKAVAATVNRDDANDEYEVTLAAASWPGLTATGVAKAVFYRDTGNAATDVLVAVSEFASARDLANETLSLTALELVLKNNSAAAVVYNRFMEALQTGAVDLDTASIKVMIATSTYVPDADTHEHRDDVTNEVSGTGYTAGGAATTIGVAEDDANDEVDLTLNGVTWNPVTLTGARRFIYYVDTGNAATDVLIACISAAADKSPAGESLELQASTLSIANQNT